MIDAALPLIVGSLWAAVAILAVITAAILSELN